MSDRYTISVLGDEFSYHHLAARAKFGALHSFQYHSSFDGLVEHVQDGLSDFGLLAVHNSLAGEVPGNFSRVVSHQLFVHDEVLLQINLHLGALPGTRMEDILIICTHPMAWKETSGFFSAYPYIQFAETPSTASGAKKIGAEKLQNAGAVTSKAAIDHYGLEIIRSAIDNHPENITRFLVISNRELKIKTTNKPLKASLVLKFSDTSASDQLFDSVLNETIVTYKTALPAGTLYADMLFKNSLLLNKTLVRMNNQFCRATVIGTYETGKIFMDQ